MAIITRQVAVTTTSQSIVSVDNVVRKVRLHCESGALYIGNVGVTSSNGLKLDNNDKILIDLAEGEDLYAVTATGTTNVSILVSKID
jgi:hypothetical protein